MKIGGLHDLPVLLLGLEHERVCDHRVRHRSPQKRVYFGATCHSAWTDTDLHHTFALFAYAS